MNYNINDLSSLSSCCRCGKKNKGVSYVINNTIYYLFCNKCYSLLQKRIKNLVVDFSNEDINKKGKVEK